MPVQSNNRMGRIQPSAIEYSETDYLPYSDKKIFNLIADVESYPKFLPGWLSVHVISKTDKRLLVTQKVGVPLVNWEFKSSAEMEEPRHIHISAKDGPFRHLDIHWYLEAVAKEMSRVTITVNADIDTQVKSVLNIIVRQTIHSLLEHFSSRAREIYG